MDNWQLPKLELTGNMLKKQRPPSASGLNRPATQFAKAQRESGNANPRFHTENIMHMELDMPDRNTADFDGAIDPNMVGSLNEDMNKVKEFIVQDQSIFKDKKRPQPKRPGTAKHKSNVGTNDDVQQKMDRELSLIHI